MALFKKLDTNTKRRYLNEDESIVQTLSVTATTITNKVDVTVGDTTTTAETWELLFSDLVSIKKYSSNTLVGIRLSPEGEAVPYNYSLVSYINRADNTRIYSVSPQSDVNIQIIVKDPNGSFNTCEVIVYTPATPYTLVSDQTFTETTANVIEMLDTITVTKDTSYTNADYAKYTVTSAPYVSSVSADQVVGVIDKTEVKLISGTGSVRVLKSSVETGSVAEIKFGFSNYPRLVDFKDQ